VKTIMILIFLSVGVSGCSMYAKKSEKFVWSNNSEFTLYYNGCDLTSHKSKYKDSSGKRRNGPRISIMSVSEDGETIGEWIAYCGSVQAYGTSDCAIRRDYFKLKEIGCPNMKFSVTQ
jgi:hypothetical protein